MYRYAANNPVKYTDPDGREDIPYEVQEIIDSRTKTLVRFASDKERSFVHEVLGNIGLLAIFCTPIIRIPDGRAASTNISPFGEIWLGSSIFSDTFYSDKNTLIHEVFHQVQYLLEPNIFSIMKPINSSAIEKLIGEQVLYLINVQVYDFGDYRVTNLSKYSKLSQIPFLESQAQMVGDFAELYYLSKNGKNLKEKETIAIKNMARILSNSGFNTEAVKWVQKNIE